MDSGEIKVFAGSGGKHFTNKVCNYLGIEPGISETITFSEGNIFVRVGETVRDKDVFIVQSIGLDPNKEFVEILFWLDAFKRASANSVTAIIPYYGYAKGDKKDEPRVSIRARVCAEAIELAGADRVVTMDLHSPQIQGFFKKPVDHLFAQPLLCEYVKTMQIEDLVVVSPDAGFAKDAHRFANYLNTRVAIGDKSRQDHDEQAEILNIIGEVAGKNVLIVDDFTISGRTIINIGSALKELGVKKIYACLSHLLLNSDGVKRLADSPIEKLICTDSVYNSNIEKSSKIKVLSVAPLFAEAIKRINTRESVSVLFDRVLDDMLEESI